MVLNQTKRKIFKDRFRFLIYEICICFFLIFLISTLEWLIIPISLNPEVSGVIFYAIRAIFVFLTIPLTTFLLDKYVSSYKEKLEKKKSKISAFKSHVMLYKISKSNYKYQLLYGVLLLFLVFIPINFLLYVLVPEMFLIHYFLANLNILNSYFFINNFVIFFVLLVIVQTSIVFVEESIYRGFVFKRGSEQFNQISAVFVSSYFYCFSVLNYRINYLQIGINSFYPLIWFFPLFLIGLILSLFTLRKKWIFPAIFSHSVSNIIMFVIIWSFSNGWELIEILLVIFIPLIGIGLILLIFQYDRIKDGIKTGLEMLKQYKKNDDKEKETKSDKSFRIIIDFIVGFLVFIIGLLITI